MPEREPERLLHAELGVADGLDRRGWAGDLDLRRVLPSEEVEQQFAWSPGDAGDGLTAPRPDGLGRPGAVKFQAGAAQSSRQEPRSKPDVPPQSLVHRVLVHSRTATVRSADVLVVDEELVQVRAAAHPSDAEEAWRRPRTDPRDEAREIVLRESSSATFGEPAPRPGKHKPRSGHIIPLAQNQVSGQVAVRPRREESRSLGPELFQQVAESCSLDGIEVHFGHINQV